MGEARARLRGRDQTALGPQRPPAPRRTHALSTSSRTFHIFSMVPTAWRPARPRCPPPPAPGGPARRAPGSRRRRAAQPGPLRLAAASAEPGTRRRTRKWRVWRPRGLLGDVVFLPAGRAWRKACWERWSAARRRRGGGSGAVSSGAGPRPAGSRGAVPRERNGAVVPLSAWGAGTAGPDPPSHRCGTEPARSWTHRQGKGLCTELVKARGTGVKHVWLRYASIPCFYGEQLIKSSVLFYDCLLADRGVGAAVNFGWTSQVPPADQDHISAGDATQRSR